SRAFHHERVRDRIEGPEYEYQSVALRGQLNERRAVARLQVVLLVVDRDVAVDRENMPDLETVSSAPVDRDNRVATPDACGQRVVESYDPAGDRGIRRMRHVL